MPLFNSFKEAVNYKEKNYLRPSDIEKIETPRGLIKYEVHDEFK